MNNSDIQAKRSKFEVDFKERHSAPHFVDKYDELLQWDEMMNQYRDSWINQLWETWQAARASLARDTSPLEQKAQCFAADGKTPTYTVSGMPIMVSAVDFNELYYSTAQAVDAAIRKAINICFLYDVPGECVEDIFTLIPTEAEQPRLKERTFEQAWSEKEAQGYFYGEDALELVRLGWDMAHEHSSEAAQVERDAKDAELRRQRDKLLEACKRARANMPDGPCYQQLHAVIAEIIAAIASANREG